jgi:hypothetical protein
VNSRFGKLYRQRFAYDKRQLKYMVNRIETEEKVHSERNVASVDATFTRDAVVAQGEKVRIVDADEDTGLELFCYNRCGNEDSEFIKGCRGLV